jgi:hypothetical protein
MSRKSKRKRKKTPTLKRPIATVPQPQAFKSHAKGPTPAWTVLGLLLTALGLITLIELFPRLSSSASPPLDLSNQLASSRFTVTNDGYLKVTDVMSSCFLWKLVEGGLTADSSLARVVVPPESTLRPTEGYTVPCTSEQMFGTNAPFWFSLKSADVAIVVYYRAWPFTFYRTHRLFRFVARIGRNGDVVWDKQPTTEGLERDYEAYLRIHRRTFPATFSDQ